MQITVLTDFRAQSVLDGSLELAALILLAQASSGSRVVSIPRLHAKVYVADESLAIVTSGNLTASGLDSNLEYGIEVDDPELVRGVIGDLQDFARLGSAVEPQVLVELESVSQELVRQYQQLQSSTDSQIRATFNEALTRARGRFASTTVGPRSSLTVFGEAVKYALMAGPLRTEHLHPKIKTLLPDLCDDEEELIINGERYGKRWKHAVRNAQQSLKRRREIDYEGGLWRLARPV